jgi:murein DD-endopeptidase MepM/ murein hydrolase activator NlpD
VKKGQEIARSGNTGHSFAPHLHYQLMLGEKVIDPFESQQTTRISLAKTELPAFEKRKSELTALFPTDAVPPTFGSR